MTRGRKALLDNLNIWIAESRDAGERAALVMQKLKLNGYRWPLPSEWMEAQSNA